MTIEEPTQTPKRSIFSLFFGALLRPKNTFRHLKEHRKKTWWIPALCIILLTIAPMLSANAIIRRQTPNSLTAIPPGKMMESEVEPVVVEGPGGPPINGGGPGVAGPSAMLPPGLAFLPIIGAVLGNPFRWVIWGGALYLASVFLGRSGSFRDMFRLAVWTHVPYAVRGLVQTLYILISGDSIINKGLSGFALNRNTSSILRPGPGQLALISILKNVDIYLIWHLLLVVIGLVAFTTLPRKKAMSTTLIIWVVLTLLGIIPAIVGGMF